MSWHSTLEIALITIGCYNMNKVVGYRLSSLKRVGGFYLSVKDLNDGS